MARTTQLAILLSISAVGVRFIAIEQPYVDNWSWRQSDVAAIARNYLRNGFHFAYPQIDWAGDQPGYVGTEFPLLPFMAAIAYKTVGVHEWVGRVESILLFAVSLPFLFLLVRDAFDAIAAVWAVVFYGFAPLTVFASREFMPDVPSLSLGIIGLYLFARWLATARSTILLLSALCVSLSILLKLPNLVIAAPISYFAFQRVRFSVFKRLDFCLFATIALLPSLCWYWHAVTLAQNFYPHHLFGAGGIRIMDASWYWRILKQMTTGSLTPVLSVLAFTGAIFARRDSHARFLHSWLAAMFLFLFVVGYGSRHQWYQLPIVPIAAAFAGVACSFAARQLTNLRTKVGLSILLLLSFGAFSIYSLRPLYGSSAASLGHAGLKVQQSTPDGSFIVAADDGDPTLLYYAQRKGWHFPEKNGIYNGNPGDDEQLIVDLGQLRGHGATHVVFTRSTIWWLDTYPAFAAYLDASARLLKDTPDFTIYELSKPSP